MMSAYVLTYPKTWETLEKKKIQCLAIYVFVTKKEKQQQKTLHESLRSV